MRGNYNRGGSGSYSGGRGGNYGGTRDSRSNFDSGRDGGYNRDRRSSRDGGDYSQDYKDYNKGGNYSDHSDYEDDYNRGGSYSRDDDYDRPSRSSDRMGGQSSARRPVSRRREKSPMWDDRDYDDSPSMDRDDDMMGRGVKKTASRRDLSEKLGVVLSNERQGVQDDRAMVALLQTALDAMQKKEGSKSPAPRASSSSSLGRPLTSSSMRRSDDVPLKRRKMYDDEDSQLQKRPRSDFSMQGQSRGGSSLGHSSSMGSGSYSGTQQTSQQYHSPLQNQYSKPSLMGAGGATSMSRGGRGSSMRGGNIRGNSRGMVRGTGRGGTGRGGAGRGGYSQGVKRPLLGAGSSQGMSRSYQDY